MTIDPSADGANIMGQKYKCNGSNEPRRTFNGKTICELFAGVGGFILGFERSNPEWNTVWFSQWEPGAKTQWAHDCYVNHFGDLQDKKGIASNSKGNVVRYLSTIFVQHDTHSYATICGQFVVGIYTICKIDAEMN